MVSKKDKAVMRNFVTDRFEESGRYNILRRDDDSILLQRNLADNQQQFYVVLHADKMTVNAYEQLVRANIAQRRIVSNIFYKDGINFHVRLAESANRRKELALKRYSKEERERMLHLRDLEKAVLNGQGTGVLVYFQPDTSRLPMSVRGYDMRIVNLDYSHIRPGDPQYGYVHDGPSIDYKIANESFQVTRGGLLFVPSFRNRLIGIVNPQ